MSTPHSASCMCEECVPIGNGEERKLRRWRCDQFEQLGFDAQDADILAESPADLDQARKLIGQGCDRETAVKILL